MKRQTTRFSRRSALFSSVLCPVDFSSHAQAALRYAAGLASRMGARLTVSYANDPLLVAAASASPYGQHVAERSLSEIRDFVDATLRGAVKRKIELSCETTVGRPADEILGAARRVDADLIVMGTRGLSGAGRLLIGSTTRRILQRTPVPVLAIPPRAARTPARFSSWPSGTVMAPIDLGPTSRLEAVNAARIAAAFARRLLLVHVVEQVAAPGWLRADLGAQQAEYLDAAHRKLEALAARVSDGVAIDTRVVVGRPAEALARIGTTVHAGLVITALRRAPGWFGPGRGAVSYYLLSHAASPVLVCPSSGRR